MTFEEGEIVGLILVLTLSPMLAVALREMRFPGKALSVAGYGAIAIGLIVTVAEAYVFPEALNVLEHTAYASGGVLAALGIFRIAKAARRPGAEERAW